MRDPGEVDDGGAAEESVGENVSRVQDVVPGGAEHAVRKQA